MNTAATAHAEKKKGYLRRYFYCVQFKQGYKETSRSIRRHVIPTSHQIRLNSAAFVSLSFQVAITSLKIN